MSKPAVSMVTLGCARNEVDSEELAARIEASGWTVVDRAADADVVVVNTCGFIEAAKSESIDTLLAAADSGAKVVATGCLAERYGAELAGALPEAAAVFGFDDYPDIGERLNSVLAGERHTAHTPRDRRTLLPLTPVERPGASGRLPGHAITDLPEGIAPASGPRPMRRRLAGGPVAPLKIASGCDRRCTFCAIPTFRGAFVSRPIADVAAEARMLAGQDVRELLLVSENSTSYGKDHGDLRALEKLLPTLAAVPGIARVRVSYLQPAEMRPSLIDVMTSTRGVAPYFDLSFQHASAPVLRAMRRFGDAARFVELIESIRRSAPHAGIRSNFIVGFPGESERDVAELESFLSAAELDAIGVFGYSDEDGTAATDLPGKLPADEIRRRVEAVGRLAEELMAGRAEQRVGELVDVLVSSVDDAGAAEGHAAHQAPEVDGVVRLEGGSYRQGEMVRATVAETDGVDLIASPAVTRDGT